MPHCPLANGLVAKASAIKYYLDIWKSQALALISSDSSWRSAKKGPFCVLELRLNYTSPGGVPPQITLLDAYAQASYLRNLGMKVSIVIGLQMALKFAGKPIVVPKLVCRNAA